MSKMIRLTHVYDDDVSPMRFRRTVLIPSDKIMRVEEIGNDIEFGRDMWNRTRIVLQSGDCVDSVDVEESLSTIEQKLGVE